MQHRLIKRRLCRGVAILAAVTWLPWLPVGCPQGPDGLGGCGMSVAVAAHTGGHGLRAGMGLHAGAHAAGVPGAYGTGGSVGRSSGPCMCCGLAGKSGAVAPATLLAHPLPAMGSMASISVGPGATRVPALSVTVLPAHGPPVYLRLSTLLI